VDPGTQPLQARRRPEFSELGLSHHNSNQATAACRQENEPASGIAVRARMRRNNGEPPDPGRSQHACWPQGILSALWHDRGLIGWVVRAEVIAITVPWEALLAS
jgi:hypothetical protein